MAFEKVVLGCSGLAGLYRHVDEEEATLIVQLALRLGISTFDTAPHYGLGLSETRIGSVLRALVESRRIRLITKVGRVVMPLSETLNLEEWMVDGDNSLAFPDADPRMRGVFNYSASGVYASYQQSLTRLNVSSSSIHSLRVHDCESEERINQLLHPESGGMWELVRMRADGVIQEIGLGMNDAKSCLRILNAVPAGTIDSVLIAGVWNLIDQDGLPLLNECRVRGIPVFIAGVFCSGLLVGGDHYKYEPATDDVRALAAQWAVLAKVACVPLPVLAIAFARAHVAVHSIVLGVSSVGELEEIACWLGQVPDLRLIWEQAAVLGLLTKEALQVMR